MKMNKDEIESYLKENCDLEHLVKYLDRRKSHKNAYYFLPVIDVLRLMPEFQKEMEKIRKDLKIDPKVNIKKMEALLGKKTVQNFIKESKFIARGLKLLPINDKQWGKIHKTMDKIDKNLSPSLDKKISQIKTKTFGKIQPVWHQSIRKYLLFNLLDITPLIFKRQMPIVKGKTDSKGEAYIELRIYADTDISVLKRISWWKKYQTLLPNYLNFGKWDEDTLLKRFLHYLLRKRLNLSHKQINDWLKEKGFISATENYYGSQEVKRFETLLKHSSK